MLASASLDSTSATSIPQHVAIIMDGNGRWAKAHKLPLLAGHKKGASTARNIVEACANANIPYLTLYAFSSENWNRSQKEVQDLMQLLQFYLKHELKHLHKENVKLKVIGDKTLLPENISSAIKKAEQLTQDNTRLTLTLAISYGGRQEIIHAIKAIAQAVQMQKMDINDISETLLKQHLYTHPLPDPDLLIRTGGEIRISNFLLWQSAYTEFYFTETLWPDFSEDQFNQALQEFSIRERRYGTR